MKFNALRNGCVAICFLVLLLLIALKVMDESGQSFTGRYRVVDGDSLTLAKTRFRMLGIDAPELSQTCTRAGASWRCGDAARQTLLSLVATGGVECKGGRKDRYQRLLVTCFRGALNLNREMVLRGMAVSFGNYETEEEAAKAAHAGLWASNFAQPADWRRAHKAGFDDEVAHVPSFIQQLFGGDD